MTDSIAGENMAEELSNALVGPPPDIGDFASYLSLTKDDEEYSGFHFAATLEEAKGAEDAETDTDNPIVDTSHQSGTATTQSEELAQLMVKFANSAFSFHPLALVGSATKSGIINSYIKREMADLVEKDNAPVFETDSQIIYGVDEPTAALLNRKLEKFWVLEKGMATLPSATLLAMVASFDSIFAEVIRYFLKLNPKRFEADKFRVSLADIIRSGSIDGIVDSIIANEIFELMRGSHHEQTQYVKDALHVSIADHWKRYADFIELFERRNLIAHGEALYTERYRAKCEEHGKPERFGEIGQPVNLSAGYLRYAADILLEYGVLLIFSLWRKHATTSEGDAFDWTNIAALKAIAEGRTKAAARILEYLVSVKSRNCPDKSRKMQRVNLANAYFRMNDTKRAENVLAEEDWSATSDDFLICISAIRGDVDAVVSQLESVSKRGLVKSTDFREWPAFEKIRAEEKFLAEYRRVFGQPLVPPHISMKQKNRAEPPGEASE